MVGWYLEESEKEERVFEYEAFDFDKEKIETDIRSYLKANPLAELWYYKVNQDLDLIGDDFLAVFLVKNGIVVKEVYKGDKTFYKRL